VVTRVGAFDKHDPYSLGAKRGRFSEEVSGTPLCFASVVVGFVLISGIFLRCEHARGDIVNCVV